MNKALQHRINAGRVAVENRIAFFSRQFGMVESDWKEDDTRVTFVDFAISEQLFAELRKSFPEDAYCSEESSPGDEEIILEPKGFAWVLDPVDGTNNFALGMPFCAMSLALLQGGVPVYGFVYDHSRGVVIEGGVGQPLRDGKRTVRVKSRPERQAYIAVHFPIPAENYAAFEPLLTAYRVRSFGSAALACAYTAIGVLDGVIDFRVKVWDIAAGWALLLAGGGEFEFMGTSVFPMRRFHVSAPGTPYFAGSPHFCALARSILTAANNQISTEQ